MNTRNLFGYASILLISTMGHAQQPPAPVPAASSAGASAAQAVPATPAPAPAPANGPKIQFETPVYDFGKVSSGIPVKYNYVFTNTGDAALEVLAAQGSCGCTTAGDWTRKVEPGKTGIIPVQFNSANFNGPVVKTVTVTSNDKIQPSTVLQLKGTVWKPIEINPPMAYFSVLPDGSNAPMVVHIVNNMEEPIEVYSPQSNNRSFSVELKTNAPGKSFDLMIGTLPPLAPGNITGQIQVKSSATNMPVISVTAIANVQPAITVVPGQLVLPPPPLANSLTNNLTIQYVGSITNVTLSEPTVNAKGVEAQLKEVQPGRIYSVMLTFPQGFEINPAAPVEFSVKSTHPQYPVIRAPVVQMPRPITAPTPQVPAPHTGINPPTPAPVPQAAAH